MKRKLKNQTGVSNSKGQVFYGVHMYPGVAEYRPSRNEMFRLLIKEPAIRKMGQTFPGRPIFVHHNENFSRELDDLKHEADGWVTDSFYNEFDGKHWAKVLLVTDKAIQAQADGYALSNAYDFKRIDDKPGVFNGLDYDFEVLDGEYKHMALVPDPRYDSVLLTPEEFKKYNDEQRASLKRVANSNDKGRSMKRRTQKASGQGKTKFSISLFKRTKVENSKDLAEMSVLLPKSQEEKTIAEIVEIADGVVNSKGKPRVCNAEDVVVYEDENGEEVEMSVSEMWDELEDLRARVDQIEEDVYDEDDSDESDDDVENEDDEDDSDDSDDDIENAEDDDMDDDEPAPRKKAAAKKKVADKKKTAKNSRESDDEDRPVFSRRASGDTNSNPKRRNENPKTKHQSAKNQRDQIEDRRSRKKADRARNAADRFDNEDRDSNVIKISTPQSQLAKGMERYGKL